MQLKVLGCSGGIGGHLRTTSLLVDDDILIDAGTGLSDLSIEQMISINHIFITHAHLDHIACLPLLIDTVMGMRPHPVTLHTTKETLSVLKNHIFNWKIWPDFNQIPNAEEPFLLYEEINLGESFVLKGRTIRPVPANHVVPAVGYHIDSGQHSLVFTGDTTQCEALWPVLNQIKNLKYLIIETAFSNAEAELAKVSKHLCPSMLEQEIAQLKRQVEIYITHLKPGEGEMIMQEIEHSNITSKPKALKQAQIFSF
jgi:ribonuclease BN (tRNA processing enzyme)